MSVRLSCIVGAVITAAVIPSSAHADSTCTALVNNITNQLAQNGGSYSFEMTMHRTNTPFVTYSSGVLWPTGSTAWPLAGNANQLFSGRVTGPSGIQPFAVNAADQLAPYIGSNGALYIWYTTWSFSTQWDMSCVGQTMTKIMPDFGVVTLTFRNWVPPIP